jgi:hypothetical protein
MAKTKTTTETNIRNATWPYAVTAFSFDSFSASLHVFISKTPRATHRFFRGRQRKNKVRIRVKMKHRVRARVKIMVRVRARVRVTVRVRNKISFVRRITLPLASLFIIKRYEYG